MEQEQILEDDFAYHREEDCLDRVAWKRHRQPWSTRFQWVSGLGSLDINEQVVLARFVSSVKIEKRVLCVGIDGYNRRLVRSFVNDGSMERPRRLQVFETPLDSQRLALFVISELTT